jgi:pyruvate/2-oxoglutarate dehydrogenase complex dihydrolipoamide dehydrogenase (E3) component
MAEPITVLPADEHNRQLVDHVHPSDWVNPTPTGYYDMVVIGGGTAGLITAIGSAGLGKRVALIERHLMGGDCLNAGCVPSKALIRSARAAAHARSASTFGVDVPGEIQVDFAAVMERMRRLRTSISTHDSAARFSQQGIDVYLGDATFTGVDTLEVDGQTVAFRKACIATGTRAAVPPIPGIDTIDYLTNETIFSLTELPKQLAIIGAGAIGCEMAQTFARFGSEVFLIESSHGILPQEDPDAAAIVQHSLEADGVKILCCGRDLTITAEGDRAKLSVASHDNSYDQVVDRVLVAAGRTPNTENLGLERANVTYDNRGVNVDDTLRTNNPKIFAAGDICFKYKFTHAADATARIVIRNALLGFLPFKPKASKLVVPWCTYTDPEIAHVGSHAKQLQADGVDFKTVDVALSSIDRAILEGETDGLLKVHVRPNGKILGATLVSPHAGESIGELTMAMAHGIKLQKIASVIHPYPTQAEIIKRAGDQYFKQWLLGLKRRFLGGS